MANSDIHLFYHSNNLSTKYHIHFSLSTYAGVGSIQVEDEVKLSIHVAPITRQFTLWNMKTCTVIVYTTYNT